MVTKEFIKQYRPLLASLYRGKDKSLTKEDIQDLVQDTFEKITLYQDYYINDYGKNIPEDKRMTSWLKLITVQIYDRYRRGSLQIDEIVKDYTKDDLLDDTSNYFYSANKEEVDMFINMLPSNQRDIVYLRLVLGHSYDEISHKLYTSATAASTTFSRGLDNLKKLINSEDPEKEVLTESIPLRPYGDKPYAGEWWWRYGESEERRHSKIRPYTNEEVIAYCNANNVKYNLKERIL